MIVYLSFSRTIRMLCRGEVTYPKLRNGPLFFFGCGRAHAMWADKERDGCDEWEWNTRGKTPEEVYALKTEWRQFLEDMERMGRYMPRQCHEKTVEERWLMLHELLERNGAHPAGIPLESWQGFDGTPSYNYPEATRWLEAQGMEARW